MTDWALINVLTVMIAVFALSARGGDRIFLLVFLISHVFYCYFGVLFWTVGRLGFFVGFYWPIDTIYRVDLFVTASNALFAILILVISWLSRPVSVSSLDFYPQKTNITPFPAVPFLATLGLGLLCSLLVLSRGSFGESTEGRGGIFLIAYQFSDVLIPLICFYVSRKGFSWGPILLIMYFIFYASLVGFRYKIALFALPLILFVLYSNISLFRKVVIVLISTASILTLFSLLTLYRVKFGVPDFSRPVTGGADEIMYGFFAEANVIFGMVALHNWFVVGDGNLYWFQPFVDALLEMIPRVFMPNRVTGVYLTEFVNGLVTDEGRNSGTAYYWVGEFVIMFGWAGYVVGPVIMAAFYFFFKRLALVLRRNRNDLAMALFLIFAIVGYFQFSRAYFPAIFKAYIFSWSPIIILGIAQRLNISRR